MYRGGREEVQECQQLIRFLALLYRVIIRGKEQKKYRFVVDKRSDDASFSTRKRGTTPFLENFFVKKREGRPKFLQYSRLINVLEPRWPDKDDARCVWWLRSCGFLKVKGTAGLKRHNEIFNETITPRFCWTITVGGRKILRVPMLVYDKELYESFE